MLSLNQIKSTITEIEDLYPIKTGIVDHDTISGVREFIEAGKIVGISTTIGIECRVDFSKTPLNGKLINNQDQKSIAYVLIHGIPHTKFDEVTNFFTPYVKERKKRNKLMVDKLNRLIESSGIRLNFEKDIIPFSMFKDGGSITDKTYFIRIIK